MSKAPGLGRGLSALIGDQTARIAAETETSPRGIREVEIARIRANPNQPRSRFTEESLTELAESIAERGVLQPILLRPRGDGFEIIAGERRWRAAQRARLHTIPAVVRDVDDSTMAEIALIENVQREDLNPLEEAEGYRQLIQRYGHNQEEVGRLVHKSRSHVANLLRLLDLPEFVRVSLIAGEISMGHARAIAASDDPERLTREILAKGLSVRQAEALAKRARPKPSDGGAQAAATDSRPLDADLASLERQLSDLLGLRVHVAHNGTSGTVTVHYNSLDQLDMICQRLSGEAI